MKISNLAKVFSSETCGQYSGEKPEIDIKVKGRKGKKKETDEKRLIGFVNTIARHSPFGRAVLEDAAKDGYTLVMENQKGTFGFCDKEMKVIALNPRVSDALLIATLAHESRHAQQFSHGAEDRFGIYNLKSEVMYSRAMEADAETAAAATCHEININGGDVRPWREFARDSVEIAEGFMVQATVGKPQVTDKMLQGAFNGWYKDVGTVISYEEDYIIGTMKEALKGKNEDMPPYDQNATSEEIVNQFCFNAEGKCYWADNPQVLNDYEKLAVSEDTHRMAQTFFSVRQQRTGQEADKTLNDVDVRRTVWFKKEKAAVSKDNPAVLRAVLAQRRQR